MDSFDYLTLQCRLKAAKAELQAFKSGEKYIQLKELRRKDACDYERRLREMRLELSRAHSDMTAMRNEWFKVFEEI